jgi:hypothetical protein
MESEVAEQTGRTDEERGGSMNRDEFKVKITDKYGKHFERSYKSELYRKTMLDKCTAGDQSVWDDVQNLYDEYIYFKSGFDAVAIKM